MNFYPFHIGDYASHTNHLTDAEDLAYRRMIDLYYMNEQPFNNCSTLARRVKSSVEVVQIILDEFFELQDDGCWHNKRIDEEIAKYQAIQNKKSQAGKASAAARTKSNTCSTSVQPTKNQEPITNNQYIKPKKAAPSVDPVFEEIWKDYPKRPGASKADTLKAYKARIAKGVDAALMLNGAKQYANYCNVSGIDPQYIKQPSTFFGPNEHYLSDWTPPATTSQAKELPLVTEAQLEHAYRVECGGDPTQARFGSYGEMRKFIVDRREKRRASA